MATEYNFKGEKGHRKVVKTIDIHEESYDALQKMLSSGVNKTGDFCGPLIDDTYKIFGGNCYGMLVSMAVEHFVCDIVHDLEEKSFLSMDGDAAYAKISETLFPSMCYTMDDDGGAYDELKFFEFNIDEIIKNVGSCLADKQRSIFTENLKDAVKNDNRPVGEVALGILMYISSETVSIDKNAN